MKTTRIIVFTISSIFAVISTQPASALIALQDDFNIPDGPLNPANWTAYAGFGTTPAIESGHVLLDQRGTIVTNASFNPSIDGLLVEATFTMTNAADLLSIVTRANPLGSGPVMTPADGIFFNYWQESNLLQLYPQIGGVQQSGIEIHFDDDDGTGNANSLTGIDAGSVLRLTAYDNGTNIFATVTHLDGPGSGTGSGSADFAAATGFNRVSFLNRENSQTHLDDVVISTGVVPEPTSVALLIAGAALCFGRRTLRTHERNS